MPSESEDRKAVVVENLKMADIQDKEVTMEGICSVAAYDQWTPLSVSGQPPKPRYKVFTCVYMLIDQLLILCWTVLSCWF